jgi:O-antigen/teichoic acid export membrane protein
MDYVNDQQPLDDSDPSEIQPEVKAHPDLYKKTVRGGFWLVTERVVQQVLSLLRLLILARLLPPREFGVLAIAMMLLQLFETFTETGFNTALIQRKEENIHPYLPTAWTVGLIRGFILFTVFIFAAPLLIPFFDGDGTFRPKDISRPLALTDQLMDQEDRVSAYVMSVLPAEIRQKIAETSELSLTEEQVRERLSIAFNHIVQMENFYRPEVFAEVKLSAYARELTASTLPETRIKANRMLLQQAWPDEMQHTVLNRPELLWIIRVIGLVILFRAFSNPSIAYFTKTLQFEKNVALHVGGTIVNVVATVILAFFWRSVWALVGGLLLAGVAGLMMSYLFYPWRPKFEIQRDKLQQMWRFGRWITGLSWLELLLSMGDSILVGRMLGTSSLGMYQMSYRLSVHPINEVTAVMTRATFPAFSRIQTDIERLKKAVLKSIDAASAIVMPAVAAIILFADDLVRLFMQESWTPMISTLRILALLGFFRAVPAGSIFHSVGKPSYLTIIMGVRVLLIALLFFPMVNAYGMDGMAWTMVLSALITLPWGLLLLKRTFQCPMRVFIQCQAAQAIGAFAMIAVIIGIKQMWTTTGYLRLLTLGALSVVVYALVCLLLTPVFKAQWLQFFREQWRGIRQIAGTRLNGKARGPEESDR